MPHYGSTLRGTSDKSSKSIESIEIFMSSAPWLLLVLDMYLSFRQVNLVKSLGHWSDFCTLSPEGAACNGLTPMSRVGRVASTLCILVYFLSRGNSLTISWGNYVYDIRGNNSGERKQSSYKSHGHMDGGPLYSAVRGRRSGGHCMVGDSLARLAVKT